MKLMMTDNHATRGARTLVAVPGTACCMRSWWLLAFDVNDLN